MDLNSLTNQSPKVMAVIQTIKDDPNFLNELKENPQQALNKLGIELNETELALVQKIESLNELQEEAKGLFNMIKNFLGYNKKI